MHKTDKQKDLEREVYALHLFYLPLTYMEKFLANAPEPVWSLDDCLGANAADTTSPGATTQIEARHVPPRKSHIRAVLSSDPLNRQPTVLAFRSMSLL